jgi:hypothetical protein
MAGVAIALPGFGGKGIGACRRPDLVSSKFIETADWREYHPARMMLGAGVGWGFPGVQLIAVRRV